jgi:hypothetical protein
VDPASALAAGVGGAQSRARRALLAQRRTAAHGRGGQASGRGRRTGSADPSTGAATLVSSAAFAGTPAGARTPSAGGHARKRSRTDNPLTSIGRQLPLPLPVPNWSKPIILVLLALVLWFAVRSRVAALRARRLEGQRTVLLRDMGVMQAALVPEVPALLGGLAVSVAYRPAEGPAAGGDFYDLFALAPDRLAIVLGDVSGHGHEALKHAALTRYTLRAYLQAGLEPRAALALAGRALSDPQEEHFATVALATYDAGTGRLTYALAGHPAPILRGVRAPEPLTICCSPPVGWGIPTGRRQSTLSLPAGAEVCFFSDGLIEARCADGLLGRERLGEILGELGAGADAGELLERVRSRAQSTPDDMAACLLTPQPGAAGRGAVQPTAQVEELEAGVEELRGPHAREFLAACGVPPAQVARALYRAGAIAADFGTALLRVELAPAGAKVQVAAPELNAEQIGRAQRVGDPRADEPAPARALSTIQL